MTAFSKFEAGQLAEVMTTLRPFVADDLFKFNHINLDPLTETYSVQFYMVSGRQSQLHHRRPDI